MHFYQCSPTSIFALLENFGRSHYYSLTYHRIEFHTQTLSTATVILTGWLRYFFLTNQITQLKNLSANYLNILYNPFSCRSQDVRPTVSFPMMLQMNYLFSGNIPIFKLDWPLLTSHWLIYNLHTHLTLGASPPCLVIKNLPVLWKKKTTPYYDWNAQNLQIFYRKKLTEFASWKNNRQKPKYELSLFIRG